MVGIEITSVLAFGSDIIWLRLPHGFNCSTVGGIESKTPESL